MAKLTERQRKFVLYYEGNATEAALKAGYSKKTAYSIGQQNLKKIEIQKALDEKREKKEAPKIADVERRQVILTDIAEQADHKDRVKAVDVLNKMDAIYISRLKDETPQMTEAEADEMYLEEMRAKRLEYGICPVCGVKCPRN